MPATFRSAAALLISLAVLVLLSAPRRCAADLLPGQDLTAEEQAARHAAAEARQAHQKKIEEQDRLLNRIVPREEPPSFFHEHLTSILMLTAVVVALVILVISAKYRSNTEDYSPAMYSNRLSKRASRRSYRKPDDPSESPRQSRATLMTMISMLGGSRKRRHGSRRRSSHGRGHSSPTKQPDPE